MKDEELKSRKIILFDGICNLCNGSVLFVLKHEKDPVLQFASLQSEAGRKVLERCTLDSKYIQAVVFLESGEVYLGSTAALRIGRYLKFPWSFFARAGLVIPGVLRERVYNWIARNRYRWFGKRATCMVPTESLKARFL